jgi:mono/diheme cytochrome c family protein
MKKLLFLVSALALLNACDYDSEEDLYGIGSCDTESVSYENDIAPIIVENCISCHSGDSPSASLDLTNFEALTASALSSGNSGLLNRIERLEGQSGAMPTSYRLTQCQIDQINAWIEQGALNN